MGFPRAQLFEGAQITVRPWLSLSLGHNTIDTFCFSKMTQSPILRLFPELIDRIVDHIADFINSEQSLTACALVCRAFHPRSQARLFSSIAFWSDCNPRYRNRRIKRLEDFLSILDSAPHIPLFVHSISLQVYVGHQYSTAENLLFSQLASRLKELGCRPRELRLGSPLGSYAIAHQLPNFYINLIQTLIIPSVTSLNIAHASIPVTIISSCSHLRSLTVVDRGITTTKNSRVESTDPDITHSPGPKIESLEYYQPEWSSTNRVLSAVVGNPAILNLSHLRTLRTSVASRNAALLMKIIGLCANHLEEVHLVPSSRYSSYALPVPEVHQFDFSNVPRLRALSLPLVEAYIKSLHPSSETNEGIWPVLKSLHATNTLETLNFSSFLAMGDIEDVFSEDQFWIQLGTELTTLASGKHMLIGFHLHILSWLSYPDQYDDKVLHSCRHLFKERIGRLMPECAAMPNITFNVFLYPRGEE
ncbi:hypothetical protein CVT26_014872 [Gymnopilus dilepis]|uniref:F-box domain-containing protein n=1 Tax=Gymnopilus dilepis TaxID=231916 RepID=A0A409XX05_9AGAR|nr:hypothetical protein CVT26_014872 [Gymnopilus dilepis]